jgi:hypothetical protein
LFGYVFAGGKMASVLGSGYHTMHSANGYKTLSNSASLAISSPRDYLAKLVATAFFYVLTTKGKQRELKKGQELHTRFWETELTCAPFKKEEVLEVFNKPREESFEIKLPGKTVTYTVSIVESKVNNPSAPSTQPKYNLVYVAGNHTRKDTFLAGIYAYLESYLTKRHEQMHFSGARMVNITGYDIKDAQGKMYLPKTLEEHGRIIKETLCAFQDRYGDIHHIIGHSFGGILLAAAMKYLRLAGVEKYLPKNFLLDRAPESIYGSSKNHYLGSIPLGRIVYPFAWLLGWGLNVAGEVNKFCLKFMGHIRKNSCIVVDAILDHRFKGAHLGKNRTVVQLADRGLLKILRGELEGTFINEGAQHGIQASSIYGWNIKEGNKEITSGKREFIQDWENLSDKILEISLCKRVSTVVENKFRGAV